MSDPALFAAAIVTVIAALFGGTVQIINARSTATDRRSAAKEREIAAEERRVMIQRAGQAVVVAQDTGRKADTLIEKTSEIHTLTNSNLSAVTASLAVALAKMEGMEKLIASMVAAKAVSDRATERAVSTDRRGGGSTAPAGPLEQVMETTGQIKTTVERIDEKLE